MRIENNKPMYHPLLNNCPEDNFWAIPEGQQILIPILFVEPKYGEKN